MNWFKNLFRKNEKENIAEVVTKPSESEECKELFQCKAFLDNLLNFDHYIAKSEYREKILNYKRVIEYFGVLINSRLINHYCTMNGISESEVLQVVECYNNLENIVRDHNDKYVQAMLVAEKDYLDNVLKEVDSKIILDENQRKVVLTDEDYSLVIAGAGAGKTTTVAAKVKYLVEKKNIKPSQILVISFTNKAVQELKDKLNRDLKIECPIATFHSTGNAILHKQNTEKLNIVDSSKLYFVVRDYMKNSVLKNENMVNNLVLFFATYFDAPYEGNDLNLFFNKIAKSNFSTMRSELDDFKHEVVDARSKKSITIQDEQLRSNEEVVIANFLYLNQIDYDYEPIYPYNILYARKPYTPDFIIRQGENVAYIEHFGITEDGKNDCYSEEEIVRYKKAVNDKILLHRQHGTKLIYTFSKYKDNRSITEHLKELLEKHGFILCERSNQEVVKKLVEAEENRYIRKFIFLICRFISNFKTNGYDSDMFNRMYYSTSNVRTRLFLNICNDCFLEYERYLKENNAIDFQDMINESARILREVEEMKTKLDFKYIIVDEYQDISRQRFDLVSALSKVTEAKIIAVGDDWQSIYAFSGSDITLFTKFAEKMGYANLLKIENTYRNSQEVIDIAGNFIQKNSEQIEKNLKSPKHIKDPVIIYTYDSTYKDPKGDNRSGVNYAIAHSIEIALEQIMEFNKAEGKEKSNILLLGRFGFDGERLERSGLFEYSHRGGKLKSVKYPKLDITFMTAHASKGLGYDNVIVVNGRNETYGFPSKIEDDPILSLVIKGDRSIDYAEERRLFYVAMTRTKNRVFFIAPQQNPSEFLLEIKHDYKEVVLHGNWNENPPQKVNAHVCPMCGYPMKLKYKEAYGLKLYICTNEPELCGFMTNDKKAGKLPIMKCDHCYDGYLIAKPGKENSYFLGCTNYKRDGRGCNNFVSQQKCYELLHLTPEPAKSVDFKKAINIKPKKYRVKDQQAENKVENRDAENVAMKELVIVETKQANDKEVLYKGHNLNNVIITILQCVANISKFHFYGVTTIVDILRGSQREKLKRVGLDNIEEYGKLASVPRDDLNLIIDWMIEKHYLLRTRGNYPVIHMTYDGYHYNETVTVATLVNLKRKLEKGED